MLKNLLINRLLRIKLINHLKKKEKDNIIMKKIQTMRIKVNIIGKKKLIYIKNIRTIEQYC